MNETVLAQFYLEYSEHLRICNVLSTKYGFKSLADPYPYSYEHGGKFWIVLYGEISSESATLIKLQDPEITARMVISYIPEEAKDRYRG